MDSIFIASIISSAIAFVGVLVSLIVARWQLGLQKKELVLKTDELETATKKLLSELESIKQNQFTEILKKRLDVYPKVWGTVIVYTSQWKNEGKPRNHEWAKSFLDDVTHCNMDAGVFFSQEVYVRFHELVTALTSLEKRLATNINVSEQDLYLPDRIFTGRNNSGGLATFLKDDLGSYGDSAIQVRDYAKQVRGQQTIVGNQANSNQVMEIAESDYFAHMPNNAKAIRERREKKLQKKEDKLE